MRIYVHWPSFKMQYFGAIGSGRIPSICSRRLCRNRRSDAFCAGELGFDHSRSATAAARGHTLESDGYIK